jgi:hypothetical protein
MKAQQLIFEELDSQFGKVWRARIPMFHDFYAIMVDRETGKTKTLYPLSQKMFHNSVEEAKEWCQRDFEMRVKHLLISEPNSSPEGDGNFKRYMAFGCSRYYPSGGLSDVIGSFDTPEEAIKCCKQSTHDWTNVWDRIADREIEFD